MDLSNMLSAKWKQLRGQVKEQWGKLTDDEIQQIEGNYDQLVGKIQERYEISRSKAEEQVDEFLNNN
ncbi:MAG: CsbD family protein [Chloroflexota bacterium]|nr:CsbD family protein [Chloroflexota bacterium]